METKATAPKKGITGSKSSGRMMLKTGPATMPVATSQIMSGMPVWLKIYSPNAPSSIKAAIINTIWVTASMACSVSPI
jgi:hypothetical protein